MTHATQAMDQIQLTAFILSTYLLFIHTCRTKSNTPSILLHRSHLYYYNVIEAAHRMHMLYCFNVINLWIECVGNHRLGLAFSIKINTIILHKRYLTGLWPQRQTLICPFGNPALFVDLCCSLLADWMYFG